MIDKNIDVYGIPNCDKVRKTRGWLDAHNVPYTFHDYKKEGVDMTILQRGMERHGWENMINRRGTTWKKLPPAEQSAMTAEKAMLAAQENPSLIKRPMIILEDEILLGFDEGALSKSLSL